MSAKMSCSFCCEIHELDQLEGSYRFPDSWFSLTPEARSDAMLDNPKAPDFIATHEGFYIRAALHIRRKGPENADFAWSIWVAVPQPAFEALCGKTRASTPDGGWPVHLDTDIHGYPPCAGIPALLMPGGEHIPNLTLIPVGHPLFIHQRDGLDNQLLINQLQAYMHRQPYLLPLPAEVFETPFQAQMSQHGWQLDNAVERYENGDGLYWLPPEDKRLSVEVGTSAKLIFAINKDNGEPHMERMWVKVVRCHDELKLGYLDNEPHFPGKTFRGMPVWFKAEHILDILKEGKAVSDDEGVIYCRQHGYSPPIFVCRHLARGQEAGFHQGESAAEDFRPPAWCNLCEAGFQREGEWSEELLTQVGVTMICVGCYDILQQKAEE